MKYGSSVEYTVHLLVYLARLPPGETARVAPLARAIAVPESYLRKVVQLLVNRGLVASRRGTGGGICLAREAARISLADVVIAADGSLPSWSCLRDQRGCRVSPDCPVRDSFAEAGRAMAAVLGATSIADVAAKIAGGAARWLPVGRCA